MANDDALWNKAYAGNRLWPWQRVRLESSATVERLARLAQAVAEPLSSTAAMRAVRLLSDLWHLGASRAPEVSRALLPALAPRGLPSGPEAGASPVAHAAWRAQQMLWTRWQAIEPELRDLLAGPPLPAFVCTSLSATATVGGKILALGVLPLTAAQLPLPLSLMRAVNEPWPVRLRALRRVLDLSGPAHVDEAATLLIEAPYATTNLPDSTGSEATLTALARPLAVSLGAESFVARERAHHLLAAIGPPAAAALAEVVRTTTQWQTRDRAAELLGRISNAALDGALARRDADSRSLSLARPAESDAARGLSRSEERTDA